MKEVSYKYLEHKANRLNEQKDMGIDFVNELDKVLFAHMHNGRYIRLVIINNEYYIDEFNSLNELIEDEKQFGDVHIQEKFF
ncbi:hypothetical protein [Abyssicoccus albus]|uniref:hypothetical protein n=1 Tax=Abyssicoccus albus TaxID=1817405 RepID=UPI00097E401D|nr:hypothetical protein [Abyssicoccus albus]AQL56439.1 hypothetical protein BVH56_05645 [Abyssicoccus albus]